MNIATMVRGYLTAPRPKDLVYAPIDIAVELSEGLANNGHHVDFFGPEGSEIKNCNVETKGLKAIANNQEEWFNLIHNTDMQTHNIPYMWDALMVRDMFEGAKASKYDILHFHHPEIALPFASSYPEVPVVYTIHDVVQPIHKEIFDMHKSDNQFVVSISNSQRAYDLPYVSTVYNGVDTDKFAFDDNKEDYLLFVGRIVPDKGVKESIEIAKKTGSRLKIIGPLYNDHQEYFDKYIAPELNGDIEYLGPMNREDLVPYYQKAKGFLMISVNRNEPFGLTMAEAMSCGTPVIGINRGSVPEIVDHNITGFVVEDVQGAVRAVNNLDDIEPIYCRLRALERFSLPQMVAGYENTFEYILDNFNK